MSEPMFCGGFGQRPSRSEAVKVRKNESELFQRSAQKESARPHARIRELVKVLKTPYQSPFYTQPSDVELKRTNTKTQKFLLTTNCL